MSDSKPLTLSLPRPRALRLEGPNPQVIRRSDGSLDHDATARGYSDAGVFYLKRALPDLAYLGGSYGYSSSGPLPVRLLRGVFGVMLGGLADVVEAVPNALLGVAYLGSAAYHKLKQG